MRSKAKNINSVIGLVPPQAIELEEAILGAIMLESESIHKVVEMLSLDCFYKESNKVIFKAIVDLLSSSEPIDLLTVTTQLRKNGDLETAGGAFFVTELTSKVSSAANIEYHCKIIYEYYIKRKLISLSSEVQRESFSDESDSFNLISKIESEILNITKNLSSGSVFSAKSLLIETFKSIEDASKKPNGITGIPTLLPNLDRVIGGWQNSDLIIIAARPAMGKTDFALNILVNASKAGYKGAIFSLEMSKEQLMSRLLAISCEIDREKIKKGNLDSSEWMKLTVTAEKHLSNVFIADEPTLNTFSFRSKARRLKMKENVSFIVVDYLQLMSSQVQGSTNDKVSDISRTLKLVAKELNIPIIALSQLSRSVETRGGDKRPMLSDLRDSGAIEQDADIVLFPYRPVYYGFNTKDDGTDIRQMMEIDISKHRSGALEVVELKYLGLFGKVIPFKEEYTPEQPKIQSFGKANGISDFDFSETTSPF